MKYKTEAEGFEINEKCGNKHGNIKTIYTSSNRVGTFGILSRILLTQR